MDDSHVVASSQAVRQQTVVQLRADAAQGGVSKPHGGTRGGEPAGPHACRSGPRAGVPSRSRLLQGLWPHILSVFSGSAVQCLMARGLC